MAQSLLPLLASSKPFFHSSLVALPCPPRPFTIPSTLLQHPPQRIGFHHGSFSYKSRPLIPFAKVLREDHSICNNITTSARDSKNMKTDVTWQRIMKPSMVLIPIISAVILFCGCAHAAESIKGSGAGLQFASFLRKSGWPDETIVLIMAMLPLLELRGAIPVGYWMKMDPVRLSILAVLGNMIPVPFIVLYLEKFARYLADKSPRAKHFFDWFFERTRQKAGPIQEFEWLGLMLFVAVPFPGTGAWTGAMAASILGMPFWEAISANFLGVVIAGILVNLLVNLGVHYALVVGFALFITSTFMWSFLRLIRKKT